MNWASFVYGALVSAAVFFGTSAGVSLYVLKHPHILARQIMRRSVKPRKAA